MAYDLLGSLSGAASDPQGQPGSDSGPPSVRCSRRGCSAAAVWRLEWNNPKIHTPERRKVWTACDEHRDHLSEFLDLRGFLKEVLPLGGPAGAADVGPARDEGNDGTGAR